MGVNVFNALNTNVAAVVTAQSGPNSGVVTSRVFPRNVEFQAQYRFQPVHTRSNVTDGGEQWNRELRGC